MAHIRSLLVIPKCINNISPCLDCLIEILYVMMILIWIIMRQIVDHSI